LGCTVSEVTQKTKDGFVKSGTYLSEKSKKAYNIGKEQLGLSENKKSPKKSNDSRKEIIWKNARRKKSQYVRPHQCK
jgi:hypothetical protein